MSRPIVWMGLVSMLWLLGAGCGTAYIKGTQVPATSDNQAVYAMVERYERIVMAAKWKNLLSLVSRRFHETRGTPEDSSDDYGYEQLRDKMLAFAKQKVRVLKFEVQVEKIEYPKPNEAHVYVYKKFAFLYPRGKYRPGFDTGSLPQKMVLKYTKGRWLFTRW